uniref:Uncharacterized protein n=1 Tax=Rhizophora mucronata TaxID=61149 RepID=A0A2P2Q0K7_RHIMU
MKSIIKTNYCQKDYSRKATHYLDTFARTSILRETFVSN